MRQAIRDHSKLNDPADNPVTIILKDADRLANIGPSVLMRVAQFFPGLPAVDPRYAINPEPNSRYNHTGSLLQNIRHFLEWEPWLRSAKAKKLSRPYFKKLRAYIKACGDQLTEVGLIPFPFPSDFDKKSGLK